jgi:hypothetical protein
LGFHEQRAFSAAVVYMPCLSTDILDPRSVPAFCKSHRWIPRLNLLGIACATGACCTCEMGEEEERSFDEGKDEWKEGRRDHYFGSLQGKHVWFMTFHPWWLPNLPVPAKSNKKETNNLRSGVMVPATLHQRGSAAGGLKTA